MRARLLSVVAVIVGVVIASLLIAASVWPVLNDVSTGQTPEYPELQPLYYSAPPQRVFEEARDSVTTLAAFKLDSADEATRQLEATVTTPWVGTLHDMTIQIEPVTEFVTRVQVRSRTRSEFLRGDLGQNARHVRALFAQLDERLGAVKFNPDKNQPAPPTPTEAEAEAPAP